MNKLVRKELRVNVDTHVSLLRLGLFKLKSFDCQCETQLVSGGRTDRRVARKSGGEGRHVKLFAYL